MQSKETRNKPSIGLDIGVFAVKGVLIDGDRVEEIYRPTAGNPAVASKDCLDALLEKVSTPTVMKNILAKGFVFNLIILVVLVISITPVSAHRMI
ncbi:MAG: hypothetical protein D5R97_01060, partial [Candidatus Syntrophonatronum acetioxidans]